MPGDPHTNRRLLALIEQTLMQPAEEQEAWLTANCPPALLATAQRLLAAAVDAPDTRPVAVTLVASYLERRARRG
ncbi:MAG: hypothetical protein R3E84_02090 [Pseudomonadales bacterium]|nr:hypothetical protein [Pseudomonadales bacterium]